MDDLQHELHQRAVPVRDGAEFEALLAQLCEDLDRAAVDGFMAVLRRLREEQPLPLRALGDMMGVSASTLSRFFRSRRLPDWSMVLTFLMTVGADEELCQDLHEQYGKLYEARKEMIITRRVA